MKKALLILTMMLMAGSVMAQDNWFFPAQGKVNRYKTTASTIAGSQTMYSTMEVVSADADKVTVATDVYVSADAATPAQKTSVDYNVKDDAYVINLKDAFASVIGTMEDVNISELSGEMIYPKDLEKGKDCGNATIKFAAKIMGMDISMSAEIKDRTVTAAETVEVPAGKFDCLKLEETTVVETMGQTIETKTTSWMARGVGVVKQTTDSMNGMVTTTMELESVKDK